MMTKDRHGDVTNSRCSWNTSHTFLLSLFISASLSFQSYGYCTAVRRPPFSSRRPYSLAYTRIAYGASRAEPLERVQLQHDNSTTVRQLLVFFTMSSTTNLLLSDPSPVTNPVHLNYPAVRLFHLIQAFPQFPALLSLQSICFLLYYSLHVASGRRSHELSGSNHRVSHLAPLVLHPLLPAFY